MKDGEKKKIGQGIEVTVSLNPKIRVWKQGEKGQTGKGGDIKLVNGIFMFQCTEMTSWSAEEFKSILNYMIEIGKHWKEGFK